MYEWVPLDKIIRILKKSNWSWVRNPKCKYIGLRIDTRDNRCLIQNRYEEDIGLEELEYQQDSNKELCFIKDKSLEEKNEELQWSLETLKANAIKRIDQLQEENLELREENEKFKNQLESIDKYRHYKGY